MNVLDIIKIIGIGIIATFIAIILRKYKPEFVLPVSLVAGIVIIALVSDKLSGIINLLTSVSNMSRN